MRFSLLTILTLAALVVCSSCSGDQPQHISRIVFSSLGCFGSCPVMKVDIQENGSFHFQGEHYTDKIGFYQAANQQAAFAQLQDKLLALDLDTLKKNYTVSRTDQEEYMLKIYYNNKITATHVYGHGPEPRQIAELIASLEKLYKSIPLQYDTVVHDFDIRDLTRKHIDFLPPTKPSI
jgi:hypothetical protein